MINPCVVCDFELKRINEFSFKCSNCDYYKSNLKPGYGRGVNGIDELRKKNFLQIIKQIKLLDNQDNLKVFEFGSGAGFFIDECKKMKINITGSEADINQSSLLNNKFKNVINISLPLNNDATNLYSKFNFVVFNDVFEHLENLNLVIKQIKMFLKPNGYLIINIPSSDGFIFKISEFLFKIGIKNFHKRLWQENLSSPHLSYFNKSNLKKLLIKHNFELIHSDSLDSIGKADNFNRLNSTIKNKLICLILSSVLFFLYYLQKILPKDIIFQIYKKN